MRLCLSRPAARSSSSTSSRPSISPGTCSSTRRTGERVHELGRVRSYPRARRRAAGAWPGRHRRRRRWRRSRRPRRRRRRARRRMVRAVDAADGDQRQRAAGAHRGERGDALHRIGVALAGRREDRAEGRGSRSPPARSAASTWSRLWVEKPMIVVRAEDGARRGRRQVVLAEVDAGGVDQLGDVGAVVDDQRARRRVGARLARRGRGRRRRRVGAVLDAQLQQAARRRRGSRRRGRRRRTAERRRRWGRRGRGTRTARSSGRRLQMDCMRLQRPAVPAVAAGPCSPVPITLAAAPIGGAA